MAENVNDTIIKMVKSLNPSVKAEHIFEFTTPLKRSVSSTNSNENSLDESASPLKKHKRESILNVSYAGSPREVRRIRADLIEARNTIRDLENRISNMHNVRKQMQLMFDSENQQLKRQHEYDRKSIEDLENQLQDLRKREKELKEQLVETNSKYDLLKIKMDEKIEVLEKSMCDLKQETHHNDVEENNALSTMKRKLEELQVVLQAAEEDAEAHKKLALELEKRLAEKHAIERELELRDQQLQKERLRVKELEYAKENFLEFQEQAKTQAEKLANYVNLEKENEQLKEENIRLKDEVHNKLVLEEEVNNLKHRLINYKEQEKKLTALQVQEVQNEMYIAEWKAVARSICESTDVDSALPHLLRSTVERLQNQEITLTAEKVELESQLKTSLHEAKVARAELEKSQKLLTQLKTMSEQKQNILHRMQKKLLLVSRERDSYRLQLDSYERDLTMCSNTSTITGSTASNLTTSQKERIDNLEKIVDGYRDLVAKLENDLQAAQPGIHSDVVPLRAEQMKRLQDEIDTLKAENERLRERRDQLETQLEAYVVGNDTLRGGQVYHLANNPLAECLAQRESLVEKLEQEVARLKKKVKNLEEGIESSKLDLSVCPKELQSLKEKIQTHEAQTQRLKDYFKSSMQEFRNFVYMLFGYKIDRTSNSLYKLRSIYAENEDDQLCFQLSSEGDLNLLENEFSATLEDMINLHLRHQKSIPVFLSAITMDLFNNRTMATKTFQID